MTSYQKPTSFSYDTAGGLHEVREYNPQCTSKKQKCAENMDSDRLQRLHQRMITRAEDHAVPSQYDTTPSKRKLEEPSTTCRFHLTGTRHVVVESFNGQVYVKIREYFQRKDKNLWTTQRGINLNIHEWETLVANMPAISDAAKEVEEQKNKLKQAAEDDVSSASGVQSSDTDPAVITEVLLRRLGSHLGADWEKLATFLNISYDKVRQLKRYHTGIEEQIFEMLMTFKKSSNNQREVADHLVTALNDIGRVDLAQNLTRELEQKQHHEDPKPQQVKPSLPPYGVVFPDNLEDGNELIVDEIEPKDESPCQNTMQGEADDSKEREACKELSFNLIQSIFVPCILKKVDQFSVRYCYGCNLPVEDDVTQTNHDCLMDPMSMKVCKYFDLALNEIAETELGKCRSEWNLKAKDNERIVSHYPTIHARNRLFTKYVDIHVKRRVVDKENSHPVLFDICYGTGH